jgi:ribulose-phosphate 3-epimerase
VLNAAANLKALNIKPAVVLNPETDIAVFDQLAPEIEIFFLMSVHPGFQGRPFLPQTLDHALALRKKFPSAIIQMDGGINRDNIQTVRAHGASRIVVGSGIWHYPDPKQTIYELLEKLK